MWKHIAQHTNNLRYLYLCENPTPHAVWRVYNHKYIYIHTHTCMLWLVLSALTLFNIISTKTYHSLGVRAGSQLDLVSWTAVIKPGLWKLQDDNLTTFCVWTGPVVLSSSSLCLACDSSRVALHDLQPKIIFTWVKLNPHFICYLKTNSFYLNLAVV